MNEERLAAAVHMDANCVKIGCVFAREDDNGMPYCMIYEDNEVLPKFRGDKNSGCADTVRELGESGEAEEGGIINGHFVIMGARGPKGELMTAGIKKVSEKIYGK